MKFRAFTLHVINYTHSFARRWANEGVSEGPGAQSAVVLLARMQPREEIHLHRPFCRASIYSSVKLKHSWTLSSPFSPGGSRTSSLHWAEQETKRLNSVHKYAALWITDNSKKGEKPLLGKFLLLSSLKGVRTV